MSLVNLVGAFSDLDQALLRCIRSGCFHPEPAVHSSDSRSGLSGVEYNNASAPLLASLLRLGSELKVDFPAKPELPTDLRLDGLQSYLDSLEAQLTELQQRERTVKESVSQHEQALVQLQHLAGLNVSFDEIFACRYVKVRFGRLPSSSYGKLAYYENSTFFFVDFNHDKEYYWGAYFAPVSSISMVDNIFNSLYFERMRVPDYAHGTPEVALANIQSVLSGEREELQQLQSGLEQLRQENRERLCQYYGLLKCWQTMGGLYRYAAAVNKRFYLVGFVPQSQLEEFQRLFADLPGVDCIGKPSDSDPSLSPPVRLKNNRFAAPFEQFVGMYSLPSYKDMDPTSLFAITYTILFGIMFGDLGQGLLLVIAGLVLAKWKKMNFGRIGIRLGISSMVFGTLYGSVFGFEELLDPVYEAMGISFLPIKVFDNSMTNWLLIGAIAIGVALICISIVVNIVEGLQQKDFQRAVFGHNGFAGLIFYLSAAFMVVNMMVLHTEICGPLYVIFLIVVPLLLIFFSGPLSKLAAHRKAKPDQSVSEFIIENFFELFEYVLSYLSNSMSFLRVGGFILSHAGMMTVVMSLAGMVGNPSTAGGAIGYGLVVLFGNLFVMVLEGLIVGIQCLRLEFYEMFSRNFEGNGEPFHPVAITD